MNTIRALIVDDDVDNCANVRRRFDHQFRRLHWDVDWAEASDPDIAQWIITSDPAQFDLFVIDLLFKRADLGDDHYEPRGFELIAEARERFPDAYILAISSGDQNGSRPDMFEDAKRSGARRAIRRGEFSIDSRENSPAAIAAEIHAHLLDTGTASAIQVVAEDHDPNIQSVVYEAGGRVTLSRLYSRALAAAGGHSTRVMEIGYLAPGASGAFVCAVDAYLEDVEAPVHHVLKISPDRDALIREAERGDVAATVLPARLVIRQQPERPVGPVNGWYGLVSQLQSRATTLRGWLRTGPSRRSVYNLFESLFSDGLGTMYHETHVEAGPATDLVHVPVHRQPFVLHALAELAPVITHREGCGLPDVSQLTEDITAFVTDKRIGNATRRRLSQPSYATHAHGDLHAANILVTVGRRPAPLLIDLNKFGRAHWATDPARLAVDLLMRNVDSGAYSMFFSGFPTWRDQLALVGRLEPIRVTASDSEANRAAVDAVNWLTGNLRAFCPTVKSDGDFAKHRWEWHVALAVCLLRMTHRLTTPGPKRATAAVAAHDQLIEAANAIPEQQ